MKTWRVFLGGEGKTDIGNAAAAPAYAHPPVPGVVQALLDRELPGQWVSVGATTWKNIVKFKAGGHKGAERRNVSGLVLSGREAGADLVVFVRDRDGNAQREADIEAEIADLGDVAVVGGVAIETIEAWVLACDGDEAAEKHRDPKGELTRRGYETTEAKVDVVMEKFAEERLGGAVSLGRWIGRLRAATGRAG